MFKSNDSIKFYLFHILVAIILSYCWIAVAQSYVNYAKSHNGLSVVEHLKMIYRHGSILKCFYDPILTFMVPPLSISAYFSLRKKEFLWTHLALVVFVCLVLYEMDWFMIKEPTGKVFFFSYLGLVEYSLRIILVFILQGILFYKTKKEFNF